MGQKARSEAVRGRLSSTLSGSRKCKCSGGAGVDLRELRMGVGLCADNFGGIGTC